jgi:hypothetical protein
MKGKRSKGLLGSRIELNFSKATRSLAKLFMMAALGLGVGLSAQGQAPGGNPPGPANVGGAQGPSGASPATPGTPGNVPGSNPGSPGVTPFPPINSEPGMTPMPSATPSPSPTLVPEGSPSPSLSD